MLAAWFGINPRKFDLMVSYRRIWKVEPGLYAANRHYVAPSVATRDYGPKVLVTDAMLARYGFNL